ncbi:unnamed protein product [Tetraodon nigroviridis]|uniref:(spotted green pufferfish) hypothetical protein n=1 Tax=Tetraodon nigroviridis TaxID=99883 RepID=Q4RSQ6_TETNG|nr:unnamed protein product [Tetraodon nigroviridis]
MLAPKENYCGRRQQRCPSLVRKGRALKASCGACYTAPPSPFSVRSSPREDRENRPDRGVDCGDRREGSQLRLTVVDTPGYGDAINSQYCFKTIIQYIDNQFERYLHDESGLNRRHIVDNRVHCCFYFISPFGHGLKPLDVEFMKAIHSKVNIVPVIAKADTTNAEGEGPSEEKGERDASRPSFVLCGGLSLAPALIERLSFNHFCC